jgi:hypothetical protein
MTTTRVSVLIVLTLLTLNSQLTPCFAQSTTFLAAIQGLNQKLEERSQKLEAENVELKSRLEKLERLMNQKLNGETQ